MMRRISVIPIGGSSDPPPNSCHAGLFPSGPCLQPEYRRGHGFTASAPLVLGFVLGDAMERALRQSMAMSEGDPTILVARPISAFLLLAALVILVSPLWRRFRRAR